MGVDQRTPPRPARGSAVHGVIDDSGDIDARHFGVSADCPLNIESLHTQTADKVALRYTWRRDTVAASGWVLTSYQTLP